MKNIKRYINPALLLSLGLLTGLALSPFSLVQSSHYEYESMDEHRDHYLGHRDQMVGHMINGGEYQCCLEKPCTYCLEKTPGHGEGASCHCLSDLVEGEHPCGECIGEILEGHGNQYLTKYFARSIAEEVGEQHIDTLRSIVEEKYNYPVEKQL